jgi:DegV family protein with EDD domain
VTVAIITDSAAALPSAVAARYGISVVPMWVALEDRSHHEDDVPLQELLAQPHVTTSGPAPGEFASVIAERQNADGVCVCTIAATMSSTYESAVIGARTAVGDVRVVDTRTAAGAQALVVLAAAECAAAGGTLDEVEASARAAIEQVRLVASVPNLDHLVRSGRVPNIAGRAGRALGLAPLFEFRDGAAHALRPARGMDAALERMVQRCRRDRKGGVRLDVVALHAQAPEDAEKLLARVEEELAPAGAFVASFGVVMLVHTGPGLVGLAWRWRPPEPDAPGAPGAQ